MRNALLKLTPATLLLALPAPAAAQVLWDPSKSRIDNMAVNRQVEAGMMAGQMARQAALGEAKIKSGRATTAVAFTPANSAARGQPQGPQRLDAFHAQMQRLGFRAYDIADGFSLAFALAYEAYHGQAPGNARLIRMRNALKADMLRDPLFQGEAMASQQRQYENMAIMAIGAMTARAQGNAAEARDLAKPVLGRLWSIPPEGIELTPTGFGDRGQRMTASGNAPTRYQRTTDYSAGYSRIGATYPAPTQDYLAALPQRFDQAIRAMGGSPGDAVDEDAAIFVLLAKARRLQLGSDAELFARARPLLKEELLRNQAWFRLSDAEKSNYMYGWGFKALYLLDQQSSQYGAGIATDAAAEAMAKNYSKAFRQRMGL